MTQALRQVREFYKLGDETLWVTVAAGHLWWAFAAGPVIDDGNKPSRYRVTRDGWCNKALD